MSAGDDPFAPPPEAELSLELDDGYSGSSARARRNAGAEAKGGELADAFAPPPEASVSLALDTGTQAAPSRATLREHQDFIEHAAQLEGFKKDESYAQRHAVTWQYYWYLTRIPVLLLLGWFTLSHLVLGSQWVFIDGVNLLFHEAGHPLFRWGGDTLYFLGGTLGQLLLPMLCAGYFVFKQRQRFAATVCLWWVGENLINIARYMHDAPAEELPLVGGNTHDWHYLFSKWGMLGKARDVADVVRILGVVLMLAAMAYLLYTTLRPTDDELAEGFRA